MTNKAQAYGLPLQNTPLVNPDGTMNLVWYRFFQALWQRSGLATPGISLYGIDPQTVNVRAPAFWVSTLNSPAALEVVDLRNGNLLGKITMD